MFCYTIRACDDCYGSGIELANNEDGFVLCAVCRGYGFYPQRIGGSPIENLVAREALRDGRGYRTLKECRESVELGNEW